MSFDLAGPIVVHHTCHSTVWYVQYQSSSTTPFTWQPDGAGPIVVHYTCHATVWLYRTNPRLPPLSHDSLIGQNKSWSTTLVTWQPDCAWPLTNRRPPQFSLDTDLCRTNRRHPQFSLDSLICAGPIVVIHNCHVTAWFVQVLQRFRLEYHGEPVDVKHMVRI